MKYCYVESPLGPLLLAGTAEGLHVVGFPEGSGHREVEPDWFEDPQPFRTVAAQLGAYFAGERFKFQFPLAPSGTVFQLKVWGALQRIPYGETISYGELASRIGNSKASRAVGAAVGSNPLPIVVPCHRVIGKSGSLTGFGGGLPAKKLLLELEERTSVRVG
jgi:methylated-DNA-[protein]-cysteine S-methyltransferase